MNTMKKLLSTTCILALAALLLTTGNARAEDEIGTMELSKATVSKVQSFIDKTLKEDKRVEEITVLATNKEGVTTKIASTTPSEVGKPCDPEDIDAIIDNQVVSIIEGTSIDVTVPIPNAKGLPAAIAGVTIFLKNGMDKPKAEALAVEIGKKIDKILIGK